MSIATRAMLANLSISLWTARKLDKKASRQVTDSNYASRDAARVTKALVAKDALAEIQTIAGAARTKHYELTLPWANDGPRILSSLGFMNYREEFAKFKDDFDAASSKFIDSYPAFIEQARNHLGDMFSHEDYPPFISHKFSFRVDLLPVPTADDFRVDIGDAQVTAIKHELEKRSNEALAIAAKDVWQRIANRAEHMASKLKEYQPGQAGERASGIFRDSLVENINELVNLLPSLNVTNDPKLEAMGAKLATELCNYSAEELRENSHTRETVAKAAETILAEANEFLG